MMLFELDFFIEMEKYKISDFILPNPKAPRKIICITTGDIFKSCEEASKIVGCSRFAISSCCYYKNDTSGFYNKQTKKYIPSNKKRIAPLKHVKCRWMFLDEFEKVNHDI